MALIRMALRLMALLPRLNLSINRRGGPAQWWDLTVEDSCYIPSNTVKLKGKLSCLSFN
jgi:hypothetical protein